MQSYGTILGQYFAAMYPDKVGRMILDGVYDGDNYRASLWNSNVINNEAVIDSLFTFCHQAGPSGCVLYEATPAAIRDHFFGVLESALSKQEWLVGGKTTIADLSFIPCVLCLGVTGQMLTRV